MKSKSTLDDITYGLTTNAKNSGDRFVERTAAKLHQRIDDTFMKFLPEESGAAYKGLQAMYSQAKTASKTLETAQYDEKAALRMVRAMNSEAEGSVLERTALPRLTAILAKGGGETGAGFSRAFVESQKRINQRAAAVTFAQPASLQIKNGVSVSAPGFIPKQTALAAMKVNNFVRAIPQNDKVQFMSDPKNVAAMFRIINDAQSTEEQTKASLMQQATGGM